MLSLWELLSKTNPHSGVVLLYVFAVKSIFNSSWSTIHRISKIGIY